MIHADIQKKRRIDISIWSALRSFNKDFIQESICQTSTHATYMISKINNSETHPDVKMSKKFPAWARQGFQSTIGSSNQQLKR